MVNVLKRIVLWILLLGAVFVGLQVIATESGEVVVLRTFTDGETQETRLWIVEDHGASWLRAGSPEAGWYRRILENPDIEVERGSELHEYRAFPMEGGHAVDRVNAAMFEKYGWAEAYIGLMIDRSRSVAIRLDPR